MLNEVIFFDTMRQGLWVALVVSLPILTVALLAGVSIGLVQALTSIQEMTLTFVPKLAAIAAVFWLSMGFMTQTLVSFFHDRIIPLIIGG
ncbi:flagellar biosynthetic protein FliQ [Sulfitobacter mediterraneus]|uniref:flagellar biosynthetic protein FliQ n=1 Tax=Sulfitobacter mediterraneus TaxID=83219 RepID=UPI0019341AB0|nr:flagellar biosynthetic protein FliQ [Sulfitobacter mediterraneus]MBM1308776.1 flagellar biosynthetic protein FliQ [Sulfitobacter mediterraneus]MBM1312661.1 flagellar biosynthetic protein FliQ [Sulfitobacter mediterraneus]MBM1321043.1 flagellar biosynthetic protein FliQ [Sulfitobacter mediterraneus]MBM1324930.1 flagellar biosynthetic protein FliQ [Sulfitobacter mediterraneus]MBM1396277.1 flagellar biosynthetic protein FliQ [Sulfitobacter mediterraneus]